MAKESLYITTSGRIQKRSTYPEVYSVSSPIRLKRGDSTTLKIAFLTETSAIEVTNGPGESAEEAAATMVMVGLKEVGKYDEETFVAEANVTGIDGDGFYLVDLDLNTAALNTLLGALDADTDNDINEVTLMFEITWSVSGGGDSATDWSSTKFVNCVVENDVIRNNEAEATAASRNMTLISAIPVDTNDDKLLLTNLPSGQTVMVTDEGRRVEEFLGDSAGDITALRLNHPSASAPNNLTVYTGIEEGKASFAELEAAELSFLWSASAKWTVVDADSVVQWESTDDVATPDLVTTWTALTTESQAMVPLTADMIVRELEATELNWRDVVSGFELQIYQETGGPVVVNGITVPGGGTNTSVGWVSEGSSVAVSASLGNLNDIVISRLSPDAYIVHEGVNAPDISSGFMWFDGDIHIGTTSGKVRKVLHYST